MISEKKDAIIGIIGGRGKMGRLFANFFKQNGFKVFVSDKKTRLTNEELAKKSDVVIISVPIDKTSEVIREITQYMKEENLLMDLTSIKIEPVKEMLNAKCEVIGLHPMFADTNGIKGQTVIMCPARAKKWLPWIKNLFIKNSINIKILTPKEHDKMMSVAQGLIHFADIVFCDALKAIKKPVNKILEYAGMASDLKMALAARLLNQDANLYGNIQIKNPYAMETVKIYRKSLDKYIEIIEKGDLKLFEKYFSESKKFLKDYAGKAHKETDWIINELLKKRGRLIIGQEKLPTKGEIGVMGPRHTYSDMVAQKYFPDEKRAYFNSIAEVFTAVKKGNVKKGIVPIENMLHGTVRETLDELFNNNLKIVRELSLPIHHCLVSSRESNPRLIKRIYSHSQAINQCSHFLKNNYEKAEISFKNSTASALQELIDENDKEIGVVCSEEAARAHNLKILGCDIEDSRENETTFIVISGCPASKKGTKTSIAFYFSKDKPGSLFSVFKDFKDAGINMTKIESRPARKELGEYIFFLDFEGDRNEPKIKKVLEEINKKTKKLKMFGSY